MSHCEAIETFGGCHGDGRARPYTIRGWRLCAGCVVDALGKLSTRRSR